MDSPRGHSYAHRRRASGWIRAGVEGIARPSHGGFEVRVIGALLWAGCYEKSVSNVCSTRSAPI
jgi:hypothetical protein